MDEREPFYGWEANQRRKFVIGLDATPEQRLDWLEEMIALAHASGALPRRRDYVLALEGTIEHGSKHGRVLFARASFISTSKGDLSFVGSWEEGEGDWSMQLQGLRDEEYVGRISAPRQFGDRPMHVSARRTRISPHEWEIRGTYMDDGGEPRQLILRLSEKSYA